MSEGKALLTPKNTIRAKEGSKVKITVDSKTYYLTVALTKKDPSDAARDNIQINGPNGIKQGQFEAISKFQYRWQKIRENPKAGLSLILTVLSVLSATAATVNSAQHSQSMAAACTGLKCVTPISWGLVGVAALTAIISWWKDNATFQ